MCQRRVAGLARRHVFNGPPSRCAGAMRAGDAPSLSERMGRLLALIQHTFTVSEVTQFLFEASPCTPHEAC